MTESLIHLVQNSNGNMEQRSWDDKKKDWVVVLKALQSECDFMVSVGHLEAVIHKVGQFAAV